MTRENWLTSKELCEFLKINDRTLPKLRKRGLPVAGRIGRDYRYDLEDVKEWFKEREEVQDG